MRPPTVGKETVAANRRGRRTFADLVAGGMVIRAKRPPEGRSVRHAGGAATRCPQKEQCPQHQSPDPPISRPRGTPSSASRAALDSGGPPSLMAAPPEVCCARLGCHLSASS